ncbi:MAG: bifunctional 5,10-methylenetetrahydrofolate dehydrogenase/5,10-methenyltetrahydrofolate cyclohydrolase [Simkania negevensis]|nr:bifunctional 5,10-methylenetetrahydrofolate dehydrogenase/5,10-methenyltetrahydrofolate cyclohydrolase [Simkania negevensis]
MRFKSFFGNVNLVSTPASISEKELIQTIQHLNQDEKIDGILVQQPLPLHLSNANVVESIDPRKDVDGFHPINMGKLLLGEERGFVPCTPLGILKLLEETKIEVEGKHVVIIVRINIVCKPIAALLIQKKAGRNATVTLAHSHTKNLPSICLSGDILVAAIGKPLFIKKKMVKRGAVVIDVGINKIASKEGGRIVGDVDFAEVSRVASYLTPVPGGVGPMTIAMLLSNTILSYQLTLRKKEEQRGNTSFEPQSL